MLGFVVCHLLLLYRHLHWFMEFSENFRGKLVTETMLVSGLNDSDFILEETAEFLSHLRLSKVYISIPTRPPTEIWGKSPDEKFVNNAYQISSEKAMDVDYLTGYERNELALTGDVERDILSITAVHPMRQDAVDAFLDRAGADRGTIRRMVNEKMLIETEYGEKRFYLRQFKRH